MPDLIPETIEEPAKPAPEQSAFEAAAARTRKGVRHEAEAALPSARVTDDASYQALEAGTKFVDPEGKVRQKPWMVASDTEYEAVPEGAHFVDPQGTLRQKPRFEGIGVAAQTLYDMALTAPERRKILEKYYPGKVQEDASGLFVEEDGTYRRPGKGLETIPAFAAGAAAPTAGAVLGALGGAAVGNFPGGVAGGMGGAVAGQSINDLALQLAGVYDRSPWDEGGNLLKAGLMGSAGAGVGRGIATVVPSIKGGASAVGAALPGAVGKILGANVDPAATTMARELAEKGVKVPASTWAKEAPKFQHAQEVFDPAFRTQNVIRESVGEHFEKSAGEILEGMGVKPEGKILSPGTAVKTQEAGEALTQRAIAESQAADGRLREALEKRKAEIEAGAGTRSSQREALAREMESSERAARQLIEAGYQDINRTIDTAYQTAQSGRGSGNLWQQVAERLQTVRRGIMERARLMYDQADELAGGAMPNHGDLPQIARQFADQLPEEFQRNQPALVRQLRALAGEVNEAGEVVREPTQMTFGQLRNLRTDIRQNVDWNKLSSDTRNGTYKYFERRVDEILHDPHAAQPLREAAEALDRADEFYGREISIFNSKQLNAVLRGLEAREPADPKVLYNTIIREGHTDLIRRIRGMVGENLWAGVRAADLEQMMANAQGLTPGTIDGRAFVREVLDRRRSGLLETVHGPQTGAQLVRQAEAIEALEGRLPIPVRPGDQLADVIGRARQAADAYKAAARQDPLGVLNKELRGAENEYKKASASARRRADDPLSFLYRPTIGAQEAVNKILGSEDLIIATAERFGATSPEFQKLQQVFVERMLRKGLGVADELAKIGPEAQALLFPGTTRAQIDVLAKEMKFLTESLSFRGGGAGSSMSAFEKVEHPPVTSGMRGVIRAIPIAGPVADFAMRAALTKYYAGISNILTSPRFLRWIEKGLTKGTPEEREAMRKVLQKHLQAGSAAGAGAGEATEQAGME